MLILGLILVLLGTSVYAALTRSLLDEVDRNLFSRSEQAIPVLFGPPRRAGEPGPSPRGPQGYNGGVFFLALLPDGSVLANPQQARQALRRNAALDRRYHQAAVECHSCLAE